MTSGKETVANQHGLTFPPVTHSASGDWRKVGVELEFAGLTLEQTGRALSEALGGTFNQHTPAEGQLNHPQWGTFSVEFDWQFLKNRARADANDEEKETDSQWLLWLRDAASSLVPLEVICPPLPLSELVQVNHLIHTLHAHGAVGTGDAPHYAFGLHLNVEIPDQKPTTLLHYLQAFALVQHWLVKVNQVDLMRRISPYIRLYKETYVDHILQCSDDISLTQLIDDYLQMNASRNRALDMLPIFAHLAPQSLGKLADTPLIKPRPTFHYRLPNCQLENPHWDLAESWRSWLAVERLAHDHEARRELTTAYRAHQRPVLGLNTHAWEDTLTSWLNAYLSA